jgi:hypothetical protein
VAPANRSDSERFLGDLARLFPGTDDDGELGDEHRVLVAEQRIERRIRRLPSVRAP